METAPDGQEELVPRDEASAPAEDPPLDEERVGWAAQVFAKSFKSETERLLTLEDLWVNDDGSVKRRKPVPLDVAGSLGLASRK